MMKNQFVREFIKLFLNLQQRHQAYSICISIIVVLPFIVGINYTFCTRLCSNDSKIYEMDKTIFQ